MYNKTNKMTQEQLRMQMLAGIITEGQYKRLLEASKGELVRLVGTNLRGDLEIAVMNLETYIEQSKAILDYEKLAKIVNEIIYAVEELSSDQERSR